jgi:hypothetical protein
MTSGLRKWIHQYSTVAPKNGLLHLQWQYRILIFGINQQWVHSGLSAQICLAQHPVLKMRLTHKYCFGILRHVKSKFLSFLSVTGA